MTFQADLSSQDYFRDPAAKLATLRAFGPVVETKLPLIGKVWMTTTQEAADQVLKDNTTFTFRKEGGRLAGVQWWMPGLFLSLANNMLTMDEPDHTRLRGIVDEAFRRRAVLGMESRISEIAHDLADDLFAERNPADIVARYARTLPLSVICELLGLPLADRPKFTAWAQAATSFTGPLGMLFALPSLYAMKHYLEQQLQSVREKGGSGLIAELVQAEKDGGRISRSEMVSMVFLLLFAGHETTAHLISGSVYELLRNPGLRDWLEEDWSRAALAVEEFLRFVSPVQFSKPRLIRKDVEVAGVKLKKGERIMALLAAANMDPLANDHPEKLDLTRKPNRHIAFGTGIHFCLGHQLARIEGRCALEVLFKRWPELSLAVAEDEIGWRSRAGFRALERLPVAPAKHHPDLGLAERAAA
jgi:cytochrome P450